MTCLLNRDFFKSHDDIAVVLPRKPQPLYPEHHHEFNEIFIVESGYGIHEMNGKVYALTPGTVFFIKPRDYHLFEDVQNLHLVNFIYSHEQHFHYIKNIHELLPDVEDPCWNVTTKIRLELIRILDDYTLLDCSDKHRFERESVFFDVMRTLRYSRFQDHDQLNNDEKLKHVMVFLHSSYHLDIDWQRLATRFKLSYRTLQRLFSTQLGITPQKYLTYLRIMRARELLKQSDSTITEVAINTGFNDSNYFSSVFTKSVGCAPSVFRKQFCI